MFKRLFTKHKKNNDFSVLTNSEPYSKDRAECLIEKYGFDFDRISKTEIRDLIEKEISPATLRKDLNIATGTMTKLRKNEEVALSVLLRICEYLNCNIGDICDAVRTKPDEIGEI